MSVTDSKAHVDYPPSLRLDYSFVFGVIPNPPIWTGIDFKPSQFDPVLSFAHT